MKLKFSYLSMAAIILASVASIMQFAQGEYFRCFLLMLFILTHCVVYKIWVLLSKLMLPESRK